ncbi:MAG: aspartate--tRNA ligase [Clostridia bacterium]|nr:aspartate--tRNA ligase [Clostridia bacterium]
MANLLTENDRRTCRCGELTENDIGKRVTVMGWTQRQRNLGKLIFIDLRDRSGFIQLSFDEETSKESFDIAYGVRSETVLMAKGVVRSRGENAKNAKIATGAIEIAVDELSVLSKSETPPFEIVENSQVRPELRMRYRYLDLRRPDLARNIIARSEIARITREYYMSEGFLEIETPNLIGPTPEGARDYLVPSRVHPGKFYARPQSPQLYKQLLMVSGFDRYFQLARCFRDEDLRVDRQPEFTQIDTEFSFVTQEDVIATTEGFLKKVWKDFRGEDITLPLPRLTYAEAMERYGSDKPDVRFGFEINNISDIVAGSEFKVFSGCVANGGSVRAINVKGGGSMPRKEIDGLGEFAKTYKAKGMAWYKSNNGEVSSSYAKFLTEDENKAILERLDFEDGDLICIIADKDDTVFAALGALRCECAKRLGLLDPMETKLLWVTDFPLFEYSEEDGRYYAKHHPFTMPNPEDIDMLESDPGKCRAIAYDIVMNGTEIGGGSIRIHDPEIQQRMFAALGFTPEEAQAKFGFLLDAFKYGVPPHGGLAFGFDRLVTLLLGLEDIRDVIAFPKAQNASELMTKCPAEADAKALEELCISINAPTEE